MRFRTTVLSLMLSAGISQLTAAPIMFSGSLTGPNEEPTNASPGIGFALVTIDSVAHTMRVQATFTGLLGLVTVSHIHVINGPGDANTADTTGPVATTTPTFPGFPDTVTSGSYDQTFDMTQASSYRGQFLLDAGGTAADAEAALFAGIMDGRAYLNIHSNVFGGGEIRDFLAPVPEPSNVALVALALVGILAIRRKYTSS